MDSRIEGVVVEADSGNAKVRVSRHGDCSNCGACPGDSALLLDAVNGLGAAPGQHVFLEMPDTGMVKSAFVVFTLPLLAILAGAMAGYGASSFLGDAKTALEALGATLFFALAVLYIRRFDRAAARRPAKATIVQVGR